MGLFDSGVLSSIVSGAFGLVGTAMTNKSNRDQAQQSNEFNERMLQKQMDYNTEMYNRQLSDELKYSDPSFIASRMVKAGYNPYLQNADVGSAVSSPSAQGINPPSAVTAQQDWSGLGGSVNAAVQVAQQVMDSRQRRSLEQANEEQVRIDNQTRAMENIARLNSIIQTTENTKLRNLYQETINSLQRNVMLSDIGLKNSQQKKIEQDIRIGVLDESVKKLQFQWLPEQLRLQCANMVADVAAKQAATRLTNKQVEHESEKIAETILRRSGMKLEQQGQRLQNRQQALETGFDFATYEMRKKKLAAEIQAIIRSNRPSNMLQVLGMPMRDWDGRYVNW